MGQQRIRVAKTLFFFVGRDHLSEANREKKEDPRDKESMTPEDLFRAPVLSNI